MLDCVPFRSATVEELKSLIQKYALGAGVGKLALYVERGPKKNVTLRDGLSIQERYIHAGPRSPYRGFLFLRSGLDIDSVQEQALRDEVEVLGSHNVAVRYADGKADIDKALRTVLME